jgi:hypothetical protein
LTNFLLGYLICKTQEGGHEKISTEEESSLKRSVEDDSETESSPYMDYMVSLLDTVAMRVLLVTETGRMGLCSPHARIGDEVWVYHGGNVPFVLRPRTEWTHRFYNFVGDCTMEGMMFGELFEEGGFKEENGVEIITR